MQTKLNADAMGFDADELFHTSAKKAEFDAGSMEIDSGYGLSESSGKQPVRGTVLLGIDTGPNLSDSLAEVSPPHIKPNTASTWTYIPQPRPAAFTLQDLKDARDDLDLTVAQQKKLREYYDVSGLSSGMIKQTVSVVGQRLGKMHRELDVAIKRFEVQGKTLSTDRGDGKNPVTYWKFFVDLQSNIAREPKELNRIFDVMLSGNTSVEDEKERVKVMAGVEAKVADGKDLRRSERGVRAHVAGKAPEHVRRVAASQTARNEPESDEEDMFTLEPQRPKPKRKAPKTKVRKIKVLVVTSEVELETESILCQIPGPLKRNSIKLNLSPPPISEVKSVKSQRQGAKKQVRKYEVMSESDYAPVQNKFRRSTIKKRASVEEVDLLELEPEETRRQSKKIRYSGSQPMPAGLRYCSRNGCKLPDADFDKKPDGTYYKCCRLCKRKLDSHREAGLKMKQLGKL